MTMQPKTVRRLALLAIVVLLVVGLGLGLVYGRRWQVERRLERQRTDGIAALKAGQPAVAIDNLGSYLRRRGTDREAWLLYADARLAQEELDGSHVRQAANALAKALELDDTDLPLALRLLKLFNDSSQPAEARTLAVRLRGGDDDSNIQRLAAADVERLRHEVNARLAERRLDKTLDLLTTRLVELAPDRFASLLARGAFLAQSQRQDELRTFIAQSTKGRKPGDPARLLSTLDPDAKPAPADLRALMAQVAGLDPDSAARTAEPLYTESNVALILLSAFDTLRLPNHGDAVLRDLWTRLGDADARRLYVRRQWQQADLNSLVSDIPPDDAGLAKVHSEVLAFSSLAALARGDSASADRLQKTLESRAAARDAFAAAWLPALQSVRTSGDPLKRLQLADAALRAHPRDPVIKFFRGEALAALGRLDEARAIWRTLVSADDRSGWSLPSLRISETFLAEGRFEDAERAARAADLIQRSFATGYAVVRSQVGLIETQGPRGDARQQLAELDSIIAEISKLDNPAARQALLDQLTPGRVVLLGSVGNLDQARATLAQAAARTPPVDSDLARRLCSIGERLRLAAEVDALVDAQLRAAPGPVSGSLRALVLSLRGQAADAAKFLRDSAAAAPADQAPEWRLAEANTLELAGDPAATQAWAKLSADFPSLLRIQTAAANSRALERDPAALDSVIKRLTALGGADPDRPSVNVRFARARAMLSGAVKREQRDEAVTLLRAILADAPERNDVRRRLIDALLLSNPAAGISPREDLAIEQIRAGIAAGADRGTWTLELARLLLRSGDADRARSELAQLASDIRSTEPDRLAAIDGLLELRAGREALATIDASIAGAKEPPSALLLRRASALRLLRRDDDAVKTLRLVLSRPVEDYRVLVALASELRQLGDNDGSRQAERKLDDPAVLPLQRALGRADLALARDDVAEAEAQLKLAAQADPSSPEPALRLARLYVATRRPSDARTLAQDGQRRFPDNREFAVILEQTRLADAMQAGNGAAAPSTLDLSKMAEALEKDPANAEFAAILRELDRKQRSGELATAQGIVSFAETYSRQPRVQVLAGQLLMDLRPPRFTEAAALLSAALSRFPSDSTLARLTAQAAAGAGRWDVSLAAAEAWRQLDRGQPADLAFAEAAIFSNRAKDALDALKPYPVPDQLAASDITSLRLLDLRTRALALDGQTVQAWRLLKPHLAVAPAVRIRTALGVAAELIADRAAATKWLDDAAGAMAPNLDEQLALATAWSRIADRFPPQRDAALDRALAVLDTLRRDPAVPWTAHALAADLLLTRGRPDDAALAVAALRAKVATDPAAAIASASLALRLGRDIDQAIQPLAPLLNAGPDRLSAHLLTAELHLARAVSAAGPTGTQQAADALAAAQATVRAARGLQPADTEALLALASTADRALAFDVAAWCWEQLLPRPAINLSGLRPADIRNNLAYSLARSTQDRTSLQRARSLAREAVAAERAAPYLGTLGVVEQALGDRDASISALRQAVSLDPNATEATLRLAEQLADGDAAEKAEAATLLDRASKSISNPPLGLRPILDRVRAKLGK